jgi:hypothetical protein
MRENLTIGVIVFAILIGTAGIVGVTRKSNEECPVDATCRTLDVDPDLYKGALVRLPVEGLQPTDNPCELVYRKAVGEKPIVACIFSAPPGKSTHIIGRCQGKQDGTTYITECRPASKP